MIDNYLISVVIPVYNVEKYLERCIDSVINQTYKKLEIILIDDGSEDSSGKICDIYSKKDSRIHTYHIKNEGPAKARNYGIEKSRGDYITFVDSDDWIENIMYEKLLKLALEHRTKITGCATMTDFENGTSRNTFSERTSGIIDGKTCNLDILYQTKNACGAMYNKLYKRELFEKVRFPDVMNLEDYVVSTQLYNKVDRIYFCNLPMYHYNFRQGSLSKSSFSIKKLQMLETAESIQEYFEELYSGRGTTKELIRGTNSFLFKIYTDVFWEMFRCKPENWKKMIKERRKKSITILRKFINNSNKYKGDEKRLLKFIIVLIMSI